MMQNATNNLNNIGKPVEEQEFLLHVSYEELKVLKALTQNPHENYHANSELMGYTEGMFYDLRSMLDVINASRTDRNNDMPM